MMEENVLGYEPHLALFVPDDDPLLFYRVIADYGQDHLVDEGHIFFEVNSAYAKQVGELLKQKGYKDTKIVNDQYDKERFVWARKIQD
jgi:release factor glutamine methyltransferase